MRILHGKGRRRRRRAYLEHHPVPDNKRLVATKGVHHAGCRDLMLMPSLLLVLLMLLMLMMVSMLLTVPVLTDSGVRIRGSATGCDICRSRAIQGVTDIVKGHEREEDGEERVR